jgi:hypothetical protein
MTRPPLILFPSLPLKSLIVSLFSFNLPTLILPFFAPAFLDLVTMIQLLSGGG